MAVDTGGNGLLHVKLSTQERTPEPPAPCASEPPAVGGPTARPALRGFRSCQFHIWSVVFHGPDGTEGNFVFVSCLV